jgi:CHAT domain
VDGRLIARITVDVGTRRALLTRLYQTTMPLSVRGWTADLKFQLARIGRQIYTIFFPPEVQRILSLSAARTSVILEVQDHDIPWELVHDDQGFIANRVTFGRRLPRPGGGPQMSAPKHIQVAVVGDPCEDLPDAREEAELIAERCKAAIARLQDRFAISGDVILMLGRDASKEAVLLDLLMEPAIELDLLHYAGHAKHDPADPSNTSLALSDGDLRGFEARNLASSPIVFVNGCRAAAGDVSDTATFGAISGLAAEFIAGGARSYIAPLWPIDDAEARRFASVFYERVMVGDTVGEAILCGRQGGATPDALAYVLFGDPSDALSIFHPQLTIGPYVNDVGIHRIIELEKEYSGLELLAVNDLPWILWDDSDINDWIHSIPIDEERANRARQDLTEYVSVFSSMITLGNKTLVAVVNESVLGRYLTARGPGRAKKLLKDFHALADMPSFCMLLLDYEEGDIEEIELVSKHSSLPPAPETTVYVFNKQTRFEDSERTYSLYEDYNPGMVRQYIDKYFRILHRAIAAYERRFSENLSLNDFARINALTESVIVGMSDHLGAGGK